MGLFSIFRRGGKVIEAKANAAIDKAEDPTEMTSQAVRDLSEKLESAVNAQATYKATIIKLKADATKKQSSAQSWLAKAGKLQDRLDADPSQAATIEPLVITSLENSKKADAEYKSMQANIDLQQSKYDKLVEEIKKLRDMIEDTRENLESIRTRQTVAKASVQINKELSDIAGLGSTKDLIDRMENKVATDEALADAYAGIDADSATNENKIEDILKTETKESTADLLASFRATRKQ